MAILGMSFSYWLFALLHFFQFVLAVTVCGLYAVDLDNARKAEKPIDGKLVYAEVVGGLAALTALLFMVPHILRFAAVSIWNFVMFALWIALFGLFGSIYIHEDPKDDAGTIRMKNAVWVDLANAVLWLISTFASGIYWWSHRERLSRFTGRARLDRHFSTRGGVKA